MRKQTGSLYTILGALALLAIGALLGGGLSRTASAQQGTPKSATAGEDGRYRIMAAGSGASPYVYMLDTHTGRCWIENSPGEAWREITPDLTPKP